MNESHWESIWINKKSYQWSWQQPHLKKSLELIQKTGMGEDAQVIDVGGGASTLVDDLLERKFKNIMVVDISQEALSLSKSRLGLSANQVIWIQADITRVQLPPTSFDIWHDRAFFHFFTSRDDRKRYLQVLTTSLKQGGYAVIATFGLRGPEKCSGLPIVRYSPQSLLTELGPGFKLQENLEEDHLTPSGVRQHFIYCLFSKLSK